MPTVSSGRLPSGRQPSGDGNRSAPRAGHARPASRPPSTAAPTAPGRRPISVGEAGEPRSRRGLAIGLIAGAIVVIVGLGVAVIVLATGRSSEQPVAVRSTLLHAPEEPAPAETTTTQPSTVVTVTSAPVTQAVTAPPITAPPSTDPSPTAPRLEPTDATMPLDTWAVLLGSLDSEGQAEQRLASLRGVAPHARIVNSDEIGSLKDGYWVVYEGGFATADEATATCRAMGFANRDQCYAAYLSMDPADLHRRVYPD